MGKRESIGLGVITFLGITAIGSIFLEIEYVRQLSIVFLLIVIAALLILVHRTQGYRQARLLAILKENQIQSEAFKALQERHDANESNFAAVLKGEKQTRNRVNKEAKQLRKLINNRALQNKSELRLQTQHIEALIPLYQDLRVKQIMPPSGDFAVDARSLLHLVELTRMHKPYSILELGSGTSSVWLGYLAREIGGHVYTTDHESMYAERTREYISLHELNETVTVQTAELTELRLGGAIYNWYDLESAELPTSIDMLVVDGPPKAAGPFARFPALPLMKERLSKRALIILDDAHRPDEQETVQRWLECLPGYESHHEGFSRLSILKPRTASL